MSRPEPLFAKLSVHKFGKYLRARGNFSQKEKPSHSAMQAGLQGRQGWERTVSHPATRGSLGIPRKRQC